MRFADARHGVDQAGLADRAIAVAQGAALLRGRPMDFLALLDAGDQAEALQFLEAVIDDMVVLDIGTAGAVISSYSGRASKSSPKSSTI